MGQLSVVRVVALICIFFTTSTLANPSFRFPRLRVPHGVSFLSIPTDPTPKPTFGAQTTPANPRLITECFDWSCLMECADPKLYTYEDVFPKCISGCPSSKQESLFRLTPTADVCNRIAYTNQCYSYECAKRCSRKPRSTPILVPSPPPLIASPKHSDLVLGHLQVHQKVLWQVESILQQSGCLSARRGSCQDQVAEPRSMSGREMGSF